MSDFRLADIIIWYFVFVYTTVLHEAGHAWAALKLGDRTAYEGGQVTLDPIPHIKREPIGMLVAPLVSWFAYGGRWMVGWASAPYDPVWAQRYPRRAAWMAMAGPAANLIILIISILLLKAGLSAGAFQFSETFSLASVVEGTSDNKFWEGCATLLSVTFSLQVVLLVLNLLPFPPLDGSAIPLFFMNERAATKYQEFMWNPGMQIFGLLIAWRVCGGLFPHAFALALSLL
ncbi:MAG TPA: site-2 protease family protein [Chthoniobacteraceae bacterium]|nr:site-2 protease family protein [Chthoniobacteraceae bacterium]